MTARAIPLATSSVRHGGQAVVAVFGPVLSAVIVNPATAVAQHLGLVEVLYVDLINPAGLAVSATTFALQPGQSFTVPAGFTGLLSVNAMTSGHRFGGAALIDAVPPDHELTSIGEMGKPFPPTVPSVSTVGLPSYLYQQYSDDDNLQAFVAAFNSMQQQYIDWFAHLNPADYTQLHIMGVLLDWVAAGLYGMVRPYLPTGRYTTTGPLNTMMLNSLPPLNRMLITSPPIFLTTDDVFKRILTWHIFKADGKVFDIRWLKRRVERFLTGENGTAGQTDQTYNVGVTFGVGGEVNINMQGRRARFLGGAVIGTFMLNTTVLNALSTDTVFSPVPPLAEIFKAAVDSGVLELPFQFHFTVNL